MKRLLIDKIPFGEILVIIALLFTLNNYIGYNEVTIKSDGQGYYEYLPSLIIYGDFPRKSMRDTGYPERILNIGSYVDLDGAKVNKYSCGTAILELPFFTYAHLTASSQGYIKDGYSFPYHKAIFYSAVFYLFAALIFIRKLLKLYDISWINIFIIQLLIVLSTSLTNYVNYDASFSHVYSLFAVSGFLYLMKKYSSDHKRIDLLWAAAFLGIIVLIRPLNIIVILFILFLAGSFDNLKILILKQVQNPLPLILAFFIFMALVSVQIVLWHVQTGKLLVYSYPGEYFNFDKPAFFKVLFSYRKGLFIYTPVLLIALFGFAIYIKRKQFYLLFTWLFFFVLITYIYSSWWVWDFGCSYGHRAYIDFYPIFCILLAVLLQNTVIWLRLIIIGISLLTIPVNIIQTIQYERYILHWTSMDKQKYWNVFLRMEERFNGIFWKDIYEFKSDNASLARAVMLPDFIAPPDTALVITVDTATLEPEFIDVNFIEVTFSNEFSPGDDSRIELFLKDEFADEVYFYTKKPVIHFSTGRLGKIQQGGYYFKIPPRTHQGVVTLHLNIFTKDRPVELKNMRINYFIYSGPY